MTRRRRDNPELAPASGPPAPPVQPRPIWERGRFDGGRLGRAIILRGWTRNEFADEIGLSSGTITRAVAGERLRDSTSLRIFKGLDRRKPLLPPEEW